MRIPSWSGVVLLLVLMAACGVQDSSVRMDTAGPATIRVPGDAPTISAAVAAARQGDLVLVSPGVYRESVQITTPNLTLRGTNRAEVIIDGELKRSNGIVATAHGVSVGNVTVRNHTLNGVLITGLSDGQARGSGGYRRLDPATTPPLRGFRVSFVTASNNALYGIYAFDAQRGVIEDNYASGSADSGIYVGQCKPCDIVVRRNVAERNAVGYEGTNASGGMYVVGNRFSLNRVGLTSNSDYQEAFVPQENATIAGNLVSHNDSPESPAQADGAFGLGIGLAGGRGNLLIRNRITGNPTAGLVLGSAGDLPPQGNRIQGNTFNGNGADFVYAASSRAPGSGNCLLDNVIGSSIPATAVAGMPCPGGGGLSPGGALPHTVAPPGLPFSEVGYPPKQPEMPDAATKPADPAVNLTPINVDAVPLPGEDLLADRAAVRT